MKDVSRLVRGVPPKINQGSMRGIEIALPSLEEQLSIVKMLDTFTELENQISTELTVRHKQYEHYRSKLLTFEETDVA
jgi:type I restriction enzyme S subunit